MADPLAVEPLTLARVETAQAILELLGPISETHGESEALGALLTAVAVAAHQVGVNRGLDKALQELVSLVKIASDRVGESATSLDLLVELHTR